MSFSFAQDCPQCGGAITLDETDRLLKCPYCNVDSVVSCPGHFRFVLPHKGDDERLIFAPYLRFKGSVLTCQGLEIKHRILDVTNSGFHHRLLPFSLGFRPQALTMRFAAAAMAGSFLPCPQSAEETLAKIIGHPLRSPNTNVFHEAYIGDSLSIIYLPLAIRGDDLYDMVTDNKLGRLSGDDPFHVHLREPEPLNWQTTFLSTICPGCGWNLSGERDSLVLFCPNCETAWEPGATDFSATAFRSYFNDTGRQGQLVLPFWEIAAESEGIAISTFADFLGVTNQPAVALPSWGNTPMRFFSPAFKIRPKIYLQLASQLTMTQGVLREGEPRLATVPYPVNLPRSEAVQGLKSILAASSVSKRRLFPLLPETTFRISSITLALLPFQDTGLSYYQDTLKLNINKKVLEFGRTL